MYVGHNLLCQEHVINAEVADNNALLVQEGDGTCALLQDCGQPRGDDR